MSSLPIFFFFKSSILSPKILPLQTFSATRSCVSSVVGHQNANGASPYHTGDCVGWVRSHTDLNGMAVVP